MKKKNSIIAESIALGLRKEIKEIDLLFVDSALETIEKLRTKDNPKKNILRTLDEVNFTLQSVLEYDYDKLDEDIKEWLKEIVKIIYKNNKERIEEMFGDEEDEGN